MRVAWWRAMPPVPIITIFTRPLAGALTLLLIAFLPFDYNIK
jgi:hypothetical protein